MVSERPLPCQPLPERRPILAGQAHTSLTLARLTLQDGLQALLSLLETLQLQANKQAGMLWWLSNLPQCVPPVQVYPPY